MAVLRLFLLVALLTAAHDSRATPMPAVSQYIPKPENIIDSADHTAEKLEGIQTILRDYSAVRDYYKSHAYAAEATRYVFKGLRLASPLIGASGLPGVAVSVTTAILDEGLARLTGSMLEDLEDRSRNYLELGLARYRESHSSADLRALVFMDADQVYAELFGDNPFNTLLMSSLDDQEARIYHSFLLGTVADRIAGNELQDMIDRATTGQLLDNLDEQLQAHTEDLILLSKGLAQLHEATEVHFKQAAEHNAEVMVQLSEMASAHVDQLRHLEMGSLERRKIRDKLFLIEQLMFSSRPIEEQMELLRNGWLGDLPQTVRFDIEKELQVAQSQIDARKSFIAGIETLGQVGNIVGMLPLSAKVREAGSILAVGAHGALGIFANFSSGNYLGVAISIASMGSKLGFFGTQANSEAALNRALLRGIGDILKNQQVIVARLDNISQQMAAGHAAIIKNQAIMLEVMVKRIDQVERHLNEISEQLRRIEIIARDTKELVISESLKEIHSCYGFLGKDEAQVGQNPKRFNSFASYQDLREWVRMRRHLLIDCIAGFEKIINHRLAEQTLHPILHVGNEVGFGDMLVHDQRLFYSQVIDLWRKSSQEPIHPLMARPVASATITKLARLLIEMHPFLEILQEPATGRLYSEEQLKSLDSGPYSLGYRYLSELLFIVDLAQAQSMAKAGVGIGKAIIDAVAEARLAESSLRLLGELVERNPIFGKNLYLHHLLRKKTFENLTSIDYLAAYQDSTPSQALATRIIGGPWAYFFKDALIHVAFQPSADWQPQGSFIMPTPEQFATRSFSGGLEGEYLEKIKLKLVHEVMGYVVLPKFELQERQTIDRVFGVLPI